MNGPTSRIPVAFIAVLMLAPPAALHAADSKSFKPNILFILADDLGWAEAAALYGQYLREAFAEPFIVGYNRCQLVTRIRVDGNPPVYKQGLLDPQGKPYGVLVQAVLAANRDALARLYTSKKVKQPAAARKHEHE